MAEIRERSFEKKKGSDKKSKVRERERKKERGFTGQFGTLVERY